MISAIILTWNSAHYIDRCLQSLINDARSANLEIEIFVIDGGSTDETLEILCQLAEQTPMLQVIKLGKNLGTTASRNIALKKARGEYLLILDSDTEVLPGSLKTLFDVIESEPRVGIAAPRLLYPDGSVQPSCKRFPTALLKVSKFLPFAWLRKLGERAELYPNEIYSANFVKTLRVDHCISAFWLVRREAMLEVGLLDERIFYAPEDVDYCLRMWLSGWEVLYVPSAQVVHHTQRVSYKSLRMAWLHAMGLFYYFKKFGYWIRREKIYEQICRVAEVRGNQPPFGL